MSYDVCVYHWYIYMSWWPSTSSQRHATDPEKRKEGKRGVEDEQFIEKMKDKEDADTIN